MTRLGPLPFPLPHELSSTLERAYATPPRAYHNLEHVADVLAAYASVCDWRDVGSVALAVLFHDAVYRPGQADNEAESALLARRCLQQLRLGFPFSLERVESLILLTARHGSLSPAALDHDEAHFIDCDMAILGAPRGRFEAYEAAIAEEYAHLTRVAYRTGRAHFLRKLLASPQIFMSHDFRQRLEGQARENLAWALASL